MIFLIKIAQKNDCGVSPFFKTHPYGAAKSANCLPGEIVGFRACPKVSSRDVPGPASRFAFGFHDVVE